MSSSERIKELVHSTLWADPKAIINLLDFDPKKYLYRSINTEVFIQNLIVLVIHQTRALNIL